MPKMPGSLIMSSGVPYDSDAAYGLCGSLTSILHGTANLTSTELSRAVGPFEGYASKREPFNRVMKMHREKVEEIVVRMAEGQTAARNMIRKLGFRDEAILPSHAPATGHEAHEVVQMKCNLESLWGQLETFVEEWDWQRYR